MPIIGHAAIHRAIAGGGNHELGASDISARIGTGFEVQALVHPCERSHVGADLRRNDAYVGAGCEQGARLARRDRAATHNERLDRLAVQHEWELAHRNSPERGPIVRNAT